MIFCTFISETFTNNIEHRRISESTYDLYLPFTLGRPDIEVVGNNVKAFQPFREPRYSFLESYWYIVLLI